MNAPNILFIQVDQLAARWLRAYGDTICKAPNLDRLAENGVVFENAYCNFPLCAPSRFSMAAGQLCSTIGAWDNAAELPATIPTYAHYLRQLGYQTALSGKMHFIGPDQYHGFEKRLTPDLYPADFSWVPNWGDEGKRDTNDTRSVTISGVAKRSIQMEFDELVTFNARRHLYEIAHTSDDRPFFLQVSYTHPHEPYLCEQEYWDLYDDKDIPMPTVGPMSEAEHDAHSARLLKDFGMLDANFEQAAIRRARRAYYGSISYLDKMIGTLIDTLSSTGLDQSTVIFFTSDHGEMLGERGMWFKKHFFEPSLHVPLFLYAPWITSDRIATAVSLVDLLPTFCGLATGKHWSSETEQLEGEDLTSLLGGNTSDDIRPIYAEYLAEATLAPIFMIRRGNFKYISSSVDPALMYDLDTDPHELNNLADDSAQSHRVKQFREEVEKKWDSDAISSAIVLSQKRRLLVREAHANGVAPRWNHDERAGEAVPWYRGQGSYNDWAFDYLA